VEGVVDAACLSDPAGACDSFLSSDLARHGGAGRLAIPILVDWQPLPSVKSVFGFSINAASPSGCWCWLTGPGSLMNAMHAW